MPIFRRCLWWLWLGFPCCVDTKHLCHCCGPGLAFVDMAFPPTMLLGFCPSPLVAQLPLTICMPMLELPVPECILHLCHLLLCPSRDPPGGKVYPLLDPFPGSALDQCLRDMGQLCRCSLQPAWGRSALSPKDLDDSFPCCTH